MKGITTQAKDEWFAFEPHERAQITKMRKDEKEKA
jgi:hypothetical protein